MDHRKYTRRIRHLLSAPLVFSMIVPLIILHVFIELYQNIVFRLYKLQLVKSKNYIRIDRYRLQYLNPLEKIFCVYCGYANGLLHYASVIAGQTERYWCGIKHKKYSGFVPPEHHKNFLEYGDKEACDNVAKKKW
ncbi:MAG TPA: hypothetical protein VJI75_00730 [Candidatus Nanoarchaeia archaeon]|nr:hypothetical protein [Candidatus Nanoarchaeia archaeon]